MKKRMLSALLTIAMALTLLPTAALAVEPSPVTCGAFTLSTADLAGLTEGEDYSYANSRLTIKSGKAVTIGMKDGVAKTTLDRIVVPAGVTANITLNGVNIDVSGTENSCAFSIISEETNPTKVDLTLAGDNFLKSGDNCGGLQNSRYSTLTISGSGSLSATGGYCGSGIGGGRSTENDTAPAHGGTIIINGGRITALGGGCASGIGDGDYYMAGDGITSGASVTIHGGIVTAKGRTSGGAHDIGRGDDGKAEGQSFSTGVGGSAIIYADIITDETRKNDWDCILFALDKTKGVVYGDVTLTEDLTIGEGQTLTIPFGATLTIPSGVTLTNNGEIFIDNGTLANNGTIQNNGTIKLPDYGQTVDEVAVELHISGGTVMLRDKAFILVDGRWTRDVTHTGLYLRPEDESVTCYAGGGWVTWTPGENGDPGILTLDGVNMEADGHDTFTLSVGGAVRVEVTGTNTLTVHGEESCAFYAEAPGNTMDFTGAGSLNMVFDAGVGNTYAILAASNTVQPSTVRLSDIAISENSVCGIDADTILCDGFTVPAGGALKLNATSVEAASPAVTSTVDGVVTLPMGTSIDVLDAAGVKLSSAGKTAHFLTQGLDLSDPATISEVQALTKDNADLTLTGNTTDGYTLTLYNVEISGGKYALRLPENVDVTLVLKGEAALLAFGGSALTDVNAETNALALSDTTAPALVISGDRAGSLSVTAGGNDGVTGVGLTSHALEIRSGSVAVTSSSNGGNGHVRGIYSQADITISDGSVTVAATGKYSCGIDCGNDLTVSSGSVTVAAAGEYSSGIDCQNDLTISDGSVAATATATAKSAAVYGIRSYGDIAISGAEVTVTAAALEGAYEAYGLYSGHGVISITNSTVTVDATAAATNAGAFGIYANYDILTINNSTITVNAAAAQGYATGLYAYSENSGYDSADSDCLTITNSTVSAIATGDRDGEGIYADDCSLAISGSTVRAEGHAYGIWAYDSTCTLSNSSVTAVNHDTFENISIGADNGLTLASGMIVRQGALDDADKDGVIRLAFGDADGIFVAALPAPASGSAYTVTVSAGEGGSVSPSGAVSVPRGQNKTFTITPEDGYVIGEVLLDGASVKNKLTGGSYTLANVQKAHTLKVTFIKAGKANPFTDVKDSDWFFEDVLFVYENALMNGTSATTFKPGKTTTRGMIAAILYRMAGSPAIEGEILGYPFADVNAEAYYGTAVYWARLNGIVGGYDDEHFGPERPITREQLATILYRYAKYKGYDISAAEDISRFSDSGTVGAYAADAMRWACGAGLIRGSGEKLTPKGSATRAQVAAILHRFCERFAAQ